MKRVKISITLVLFSVLFLFIQTAECENRKRNQTEGVEESSSKDPIQSSLSNPPLPIHSGLMRVVNEQSSLINHALVFISFAFLYQNLHVSVFSSNQSHEETNRVSLMQWFFWYAFYHFQTYTVQRYLPRPAIASSQLYDAHQTPAPIPVGLLEIALEQETEFELASLDELVISIFKENSLGILIPKSRSISKILTKAIKFRIIDLSNVYFNEEELSALVRFLKVCSYHLEVSPNTLQRHKLLNLEDLIEADLSHLPLTPVILAQFEMLFSPSTTLRMLALTTPISQRQKLWELVKALKFTSKLFQEFDLNDFSFK